MKKYSLLDPYLSAEFENAPVEVELPDNAILAGKKIVSLDFPKTCLIVLINRDNKFITPNGITELHSGDKIMVMMNSEDEEEKIKLALGI